MPAYGIVLSLLGASSVALANLVVLALAVRDLGPGPVGQYALVLAIAGVLGVLEATLTVMATQRMSAPLGEPGHRAAPARAARVAGLVLLGVSTAVAALFAVGGAGGPVAIGLVGGVGAAYAVTLGTAGSLGRAQAAERFGVIGAAALASAVVRVGAVVLLMPHWGLGALGASALLSALVARAPLVPRTDPDAGGVHSEVPVGRTLRESWALLTLGISEQVLLLIDLVVISLLRGTAATGLYRLGAAAPMAAGSLLLRAFEALLPRLASTDDAAQQRLARRAGAALAATGGLAFGALAGLGGPVARLLVGEQSDVAAAVVSVLAVVFVLACAVHVPFLVTKARGEQHHLARLVPAECAMNLLLTVCLVSLLGTEGAALGTLATRLVLYLVLFPRSPARGSTPVRTLWTHGFLPAGGSAATGLAVASLVSSSVADDVTRIVVSGAAVSAIWGIGVVIALRKRALPRGAAVG